MFYISDGTLWMCQHILGKSGYEGLGLEIEVFILEPVSKIALFRSSIIDVWIQEKLYSRAEGSCKICCPIEPSNLIF